MHTRSALGYVAAVVAAIAVPAAFLPAHGLLQGRPGTVALAQIILVLVIASYWGTKHAVVASLVGVLAWDYWFLPPYFAFKLEHLSRDEDALLAAFLVASILVGQLSSHVRKRAVEAERSRQETERLYAELKRENTRREQAEAALRERDARIRRLVDANIVGIRFTDADGVTVDANDAYLEMLGYTRDDLGGGKLSLGSLTPPEYAAADRQAIDEMNRTGRFVPFEKEYIRKDGRRVPVLVGGALLDGGRATSVGFVLDLTERKRAEAEREARLAAELATRAKSEFLANMSHELRTPLNSILGYAQILKHEPALNDKQRTGLDTIEASGRHLLTLINDILDLSRIESGRLDLAPAPTDLCACLGLVTDLIRVQAEQRGLTFHSEIAPDLPRAVGVDEKRLRQVLLNLLGNSVKFTDAGEVRLQVSGTPLAARHFRLNVEVSDTGIGIPAEHLATIFEPFEQVGEARRRIAGAGLGLAISRALVRLMGGDIGVESSAKGSRFWLDIDVPVVDESVRTPIDQRRVNGYEGPRKTVLIVDDVDTNRAMLVAYLRMLGFDTVEAVHGQEALDRAEATPMDLVLMDTMMPVMDGLEATRRLRGLPFGAELPIIAVSARAFAADAESCLQAGANAFLVKPVDLGRLVELIGGLLNLKWIESTS